MLLSLAWLSDSLMIPSAKDFSLRNLWIKHIFTRPHHNAFHYILVKPANC